MIFLLVLMFVLGFLAGLTFAVWLVTFAGYEWAEVMRRWHLALVYWRHKEEIDAELEAMGG